jgi:hypothetical protein
MVAPILARGTIWKGTYGWGIVAGARGGRGRDFKRPDIAIPPPLSLQHGYPPVGRAGRVGLPRPLMHPIQARGRALTDGRGGTGPLSKPGVLKMGIQASSPLKNS